MDETFDNVFDALSDTAAEAANLTARADLMIGIRQKVTSWDIPQEQAAVRLGLTRPRLNDLMRGKVDKFSLDALVNIATAAGFKLRIALDEPHAA
ncbi:helix-turn-helix domain-containing protein [Rhizobium sp. PP-CC-3G-465]|uniref:helix-turn-helix domain-containing protein n=1 Tax=Rhizobium sp. PP-CC-3G-465 TaxID=2135648 RepID=UPI00105136E2|nr:putative XRE-type DNA-binding protein [Rhizobium sp. PP-CC-3G-465]